MNLSPTLPQTSIEPFAIGPRLGLPIKDGYIKDRRVGFYGIFVVVLLLRGLRFLGQGFRVR